MNQAKWVERVWKIRVHICTSATLNIFIIKLTYKFQLSKRLCTNILRVTLSSDRKQ